MVMTAVVLLFDLVLANVLSGCSIGNHVTSLSDIARTMGGQSGGGKGPGGRLACGTDTERGSGEAAEWRSGNRAT